MTTLPQFLGLGGRTVTLAENFRIGIDALLAQKLRSFLTTLGIIFGVAAVISMTSISAGAQSEILDAIQSLGVNNIIVSILEPEDTDLLLENRRTNPNWLTLEDAQAIRDLLTDAGAVVPIRRVEEKVHFPVEGGSGIVGTSPEFQTVFHIRLIAGRFISDDDVNSRAPVGVITETLRRELFPLSNPLGQQVKVKKSWFTIIGVIEPPLGGFTSAGLDLPDMSDDVYIPLSTLNARFAVKKTESPLEAVVINIPNENKVRSVANAAERIISRRHRKAEDFQIIVPVELLEQSKQTQRIFNIVMGAIASISLLVGGIGIMNIMLSNVVERTREIGIRRAMGARRSDVVSQFLLEAILLSLIGGIAGVVIGILMAWGITQFAGWNTAIGPMAVILAFVVSATVGIVFGWWPAKKAAELDVINALRYE
ncbi:macrolide export ATP-binding/permease protein MacB [bacterium BMS3Bbin04]|nr:macrolide export ATP-binding/permease protein MacB [bacterium BMS3Bbin04]